MSTNDAKILFTGPVGVGKTTAISVISEIETVKTDARASDMTSNRKGHTTTALDYGVILLEDSTKVHLYGTPGQERFDFMWEILSTGGIGLVLLIDNTRPNPIKDLNFFIDSFSEYLKTAQLVIGITKMDKNPVPSLETYTSILGILNIKAPLFEVDARCKEDIRQLIIALLYSIDPGLEG